MSSREDSAADILPVVAGSEVIASVCVCVGAGWQQEVKFGRE